MGREGAGELMRKGIREGEGGEVNLTGRADGWECVLVYRDVCAGWECVLEGCMCWMGVCA